VVAEKRGRQKRSMPRACRPVPSMVSIQKVGERAVLLKSIERGEAFERYSSPSELSRIGRPQTLTRVWLASEVRPTEKMQARRMESCLARRGAAAVL